MDRNLSVLIITLYLTGQARKSLWIETLRSLRLRSVGLGQARKSLWIET